MTVYQDGIYYKQKGGWISIGKYVYQPVNNNYYSFETKETKRIDSSNAIFNFVEWGKDLLCKSEATRWGDVKRVI